MLVYINVSTVIEKATKFFLLSKKTFLLLIKKISSISRKTFPCLLKKQKISYLPRQFLSYEKKISWLRSHLFLGRRYLKQPISHPRSSLLSKQIFLQINSPLTSPFFFCHVLKSVITYYINKCTSPNLKGIKPWNKVVKIKKHWRRRVFLLSTTVGT